MAKWLSSCVKKESEVKQALTELTTYIREYRDAAKPSACRGGRTKFWNYGLDWFRPNWILFSVIMIGCGIGGVVFAHYVPGCSAEFFHNWTDLSLKITIPVFTIGISFVALARSIGEGNKFTGEYLNESCRTETFCRMALVAALCGAVGYVTSTIEKMPTLAVAGICAASLGVAFNSLITLAFVMCEAIRCFSESKSITVVSQYVARKLTWDYLRENYINILEREYDDSVKERCKEKANKALKWRESKIYKENDDFWGSQENKLNEAMKRAVRNANPIQVAAYLDAINIPQSIVRQVRKNHRVIRDAVGANIRREWRFLRLYLLTLRELLEVKNTDVVDELAHIVRNSLWDEVQDIMQTMDHHAMKMYTWLVQEMYAVIGEAEQEQKKTLWQMRAEFGCFYKDASRWLEDVESKGVNTNEMRLVLHEGLTQWLKLAIQKNDTELIVQLCDAGRGIVFQDDKIKFDHVDVVRQHFVLGGWLIGLAKSGQVTPTAIERLFSKEDSQWINVDFDELVNFYISIPPSPETLVDYKRIFSSTMETSRDLFSGSYSSCGLGITGYHEMARVFVFLAAYALKAKSPKANINMANKVTMDDIEIVKQVFQRLCHPIKGVKNWIQLCDAEQEDKETKEIADAPLDESKVKEHEAKFWEGYSRSVPVLSLCLKNRNYKIEKDIKNQWHYHVSKKALFDWKYPISGAEGNEYGRKIGRQMENNILKRIIDDGRKAETEIKGGITEGIGQAVEWLKYNGCAKDEGFVIVKGEMVDVELYKDKDYVPAWKEEIKSTGFDGFYRGYPIVHYRDSEGGKEKNKNTEKSNHCQKVIGVDLRGWTGLRVRKEVVSDTARKYGELKIRNWTDEDIQKILDANKLDQKNIAKVRSYCPVDVTFYWEFQEEPPKTKSFKFNRSATASKGLFFTYTTGRKASPIHPSRGR